MDIGYSEIGTLLASLSHKVKLNRSTAILPEATGVALKTFTQAFLSLKRKCSLGNHFASPEAGSLAPPPYW